MSARWLWFIGGDGALTNHFLIRADLVKIEQIRSGLLGMVGTVVNCNPEPHLKSVTATTVVWNLGLRGARSSNFSRNGSSSDIYVIPSALLILESNLKREDQCVRQAKQVHALDPTRRLSVGNLWSLASRPSRISLLKIKYFPEWESGYAWGSYLLS